ncbi:3459_t:CDS:10 [Ambispora gerdemannii]|uniref:3459_t:CDS:1 n=1 Tax=Ambispora gerdemannii TaxID=144530 RepID=A0A9N8YN42_9GLOM|nr:3459_t:CDS:10 [Ambispora gerdemannii]
MSSKYSTLPDIDTQPDVYETPDNPEDPEGSDDGYILTEEANEDIVRDKISVNDAVDKFKDSIVDSSKTDFSDRLSRHKKQMYKVSSRKPLDTTEYEILPRENASQETPLQKLQRLKYEVQELEEQVEKNKDDPSILQISQGDMISQITHLQNDLNRIQGLGDFGSSLNEQDGTIIRQAELGKRLIHQLETFKNIGFPKEDGISDEKDATADDDTTVQASSIDSGKNVVTYELYYSPETIKTHALAKTSELDDRISALEKLVGTSHGQNFDDLSLNITNTNLIAAVEKLEQHMQLLVQPRHLESITRKVKTLTSELEKVNDLKNKELSNGGVIPFETGEKINHLFNLLDKIDPLISIAPALVNRLKALQQLHNEAAVFNDTIKMLAGEQGKIGDELKSLNDVAGKLEKSLKENDDAIQSNIKVVDERVSDLAQRLDKLLNSGEIACRVIRTAKALGIKTVAVYSEADRKARHVKLADEAYLIGPSSSRESYLNIEKIISVAKRSGAQAIHPGYGFLSENHLFAERLSIENITFIGPPASAIISMGSKSESKEIMTAANVPIVPGYHGPNQDPVFLKGKAAEIGYPVLIKAIKGGGGKGMRIVNDPSEFNLQLESSKQEAIKSFDDDQVLIEKYLLTPRHIEVQIFADIHGNAVYLFERDCSVQRRHQKVLEEAPAPGLSEELRHELGEKAVTAAKAVNYVGAGTVEFIFDNETQQFYFMEMNTRLQVEHPVTEMVTDTDLVQWQLEVAAGNKLPLMQNDLRLNGHAFEARIYAENPDTNFLPDAGPLIHLHTPQPSSTVRLETGFEQGDEISVHYDPMIAKLIVKGNDRTEALRILRKALNDYEVVGLHTNIEFLKKLSSHPAFINEELETGFIEKYKTDLFTSIGRTNPIILAQAAISLTLIELEKDQSRISGTLDPFSPWSTLTCIRLNTKHTRHISLSDSNESESIVDIQFKSNGTFDVKVNQGGETLSIFTGVMAKWNEAQKQIILDIDDRKLRSRVILDNNKRVVVFGEHGKTVLQIPTPAYLSAETSDVVGSIKTPMPCKISQIFVTVGQVVEKGTPLIVLEAMKMEHLIKSPLPGKIEKIFYKVGDLVEENKNLVAFAE